MFKRALLLSAAMLLGLAVPVLHSRPATAASPTFPPIANWLSVFNDEFDSTFNGQHIVDTKNTDDAATPDGLDDRLWAVNRTYSDPEGISVSPDAIGGDPGRSAGAGYLTLRAYTDATGRRINPDWLRTGENDGARRGMFESTFGYLEARIKLAQPVGANEAFFLYSRDLTGPTGNPLRDPAAAGAEIDVEEEFAPGQDTIHHTIHWDGYRDAHRSEGSGAIPCPTSSCYGNFHTYGVLWDPTGYRFFIDGQETYFQALGLSHHPLFMFIGAATDTGQDLGPLGDPRNALMLVDYVKVYQPAVSDIANVTIQRNVPTAVPFTVSAVRSDDPNLPGPRVSTVDAVSSNQNVIRNTDLKISGTGADRTLAMMSRFTSGQAGTTTITVRSRNAAGAVLGSDTFTVTVNNPAAAVPTLASGVLPDLSLPQGRPTALEFTTAAAEGSAPTVTAHSSNQYLLPDGNLALAGDRRQRTLALTPLPTRTGTADVTITVTDPADQSISSDSFRVNVTLDQLLNPGFESGQAPWTLVGGNPLTVTPSAAHSGAQGLHVDVAAAAQTIAVEPNTTYAVGAWGRTSAAGGLFDIGVLDTNTYPDSDPDGLQTKSVRFDSTEWSRKEVLFTTGNFTHQIMIFASNAFVSSTPFDVDDFYLVDAPNLTHVPDQSIGHASCVMPRVYAGRVGNASDAWTINAAVTGGDAGLISGLSLVSTSTLNPYERAVKITPIADQTRSGSVTVTVTATDVEGRQNSDSFTVWVNAGSFANGSFEHNPIADTNQNNEVYPGCGLLPRAWNNFFAPNASWEILQTYDWKYGYNNYGLRLRQVLPEGGNAFGGFVFQEVSGLQPNTEYIASAWLSLATYPDQNASVPDGAQLKVEGDITAISPTTGVVARTTTGWSAQPLMVRFRTGSAGTARVLLQGPNHPTYTAMIHDVTLLPAT